MYYGYRSLTYISLGCTNFKVVTRKKISNKLKNQSYPEPQINCGQIMMNPGLTPSHPNAGLCCRDTNIFLSLSMCASEDDLHSDPVPWGRLSLGLEALGLMELGQGPVFTFPLTEEAQDERATTACTDTYHPHTQPCTLTGKLFGCTRGLITAVIE